jgi:hypothetical protein
MRDRYLMIYIIEKSIYKRLYKIIYILTIYRIFSYLYTFLLN